jgi:hypothetical protein
MPRAYTRSSIPDFPRSLSVEGIVGEIYRKVVGAVDHGHSSPTLEFALGILNLALHPSGLLTEPICTEPAEGERSASRARPAGLRARPTLTRASFPRSSQIDR